jgi:hypothetical protein
LGIPASTNPAGRSRSLQLPIAVFIPIVVLLASFSLSLCARNVLPLACAGRYHRQDIRMLSHAGRCLWPCERTWFGRHRCTLIFFLASSVLAGKLSSCTLLLGLVLSTHTHTHTRDTHCCSFASYLHASFLVLGKLCSAFTTWVITEDDDNKECESKVILPFHDWGLLTQKLEENRRGNITGWRLQMYH